MNIFGSEGEVKTVLGGLSSTDNALARWDGTTGTLLQDSSATLSDSGDLTVQTVNGVRIYQNTNSVVIGDVSDISIVPAGSNCDLGDITNKFDDLWMSGDANIPTVLTSTINERVFDSGVTVDGVLLKDSQVSTDQINELTPGSGVLVDLVLLKDGQVNTNQINELTPAAGISINAELKVDTISEKTNLFGVLIENVLFYGGYVATNQINERTANSGVTIDGLLVKDSEIYTDRINEKTVNNGILMEGVTMKDNTVTTTKSNASVASGIINANNSYSDTTTADSCVIYSEMKNCYNPSAGNTQGRWNYKLKNASPGNTGGIRISEPDFLDMTNKAGVSSGIVVARLSSAGTWTTFSDERVKKNITEIDQKDAINALDSIRPVHYCYKFCTCDNKQICETPEGTPCSLGFLANEIKNACSGKFAGIVMDYGEVSEEELKSNDAFQQGDHIYGLNTGELTPIIWSVLKNLKARIEALEAL